MAAASSQKRTVIVNADDYGFSPAITEGILRAAREGIVRSTTVAANMPHAERALERLVEAPQLAVGVHLNASQGPSLSGRPELLGPDGRMNRTATGVILACLKDPRMLDAVECEFDAQIRWVLERGLRPSHLDSHRHSHGFVPLFARVARLARRYDIPFVRRLGEHLPGGPWPAAPAKQRRNSRILTVLGRVNALRYPRLHATAGTWGVAHTGGIDVSWLRCAARRLPATTMEIMTHPGEDDDLAAGASRLGDSRRIELDALCDPRVLEAFKRQGIRLANYRDLT
jgi:predicted glycoside hydrolase/deacetylase ChbG (UPF0249 family)